MSANPLKTLANAGQSVWFDFIRRDLLEDGSLQRMIDEDALMGMTTNPSIFANAVAASDLYDADIKEAKAAGKDAAATFEQLAVKDVQKAADIFAGVFKSTGGRDGYVSIEVSPTLANDSAGTIAEARRLWKACDRPNIMIKIPGTKAGLPAIEEAIYEGLNVNVTLLFSVERHIETMDAWLRGLERRQKEGLPIDGINSVASFFISRVDVLIDQKLDALSGDGVDGLKHTIAIANAKAAYQAFLKVYNGERFQALKAHGAMPMRPLWASTSTKTPGLSDVLYVETLIGPHTVNTLPPKTFDAFRDHGTVAQTIESDVTTALAQLKALKAHGVDIGAATDHLEEDGVAKFVKAFESLLETVRQKAEAV